jgi:hypothetical protein
MSHEDHDEPCHEGHEGHEGHEVSCRTTNDLCDLRVRRGWDPMSHEDHDEPCHEGREGHEVSCRTGMAFVIFVFVVAEIIVLFVAREVRLVPTP